MLRRDFCRLAGVALAWPVAVRAQQRRRIPTIGVLWHAAGPEEEGPYFKALVQGFKDLGYVEGENLRLEHRFPNEIPDRFRTMARELVSQNVDVLIGVGSATAFYVKDATTTIPMIFIFVPDPVGTKLVASLARPGGNITGLTNFAADLIGKRLEFLKEMIPGLSQIALLVNPNTQVARLYKDVTDAAAAKLQLISHTFEARSRDEFEPAFDAMVGAGMQAVTVNSEGLAFQQKAYMAQLALARRLPLSVWSRETLEAGALMSYGANQVAMCRRAAVFADKILKGTKPSEIPVEEPSVVEFFINQKTAKALGISIPQTLLVAATDVFE
jgi:putative ABC transport system substrate-binding protein